MKETNELDVVRELSNSLTKSQIKMLSQVKDLCINEGATTKTIAPLLAVLIFDFKRKPSKKEKEYAAKLAKTISGRISCINS